MLQQHEYEVYKSLALKMFEKAHIILSESEKCKIEVADYGFGFDSLASTGLELIVYENNRRYCAKELVCLPGQISPEHKHPPLGQGPGKMETFRCRFGTAYLYVEGEHTKNPYVTKDMLPSGREKTYTVWHEIILLPGDQYTLEPGILHWFTGGKEGAVISEFSSASRDEADIFTDPDIKRMPEIVILY